MSAPAASQPKAAKQPIVRKPPTFVKAAELVPQQVGVNLKLKVQALKVLIDKTKSDGSKFKVAEALVGDNTACVILTAKNDAIDAVQPGSTIEVRNGRIEMFKGFMRLTVDKWGKIAKATEAATFNVNLEKNMSAVEYELVVEDEAAPTEAQ